SHGSGIKNPTLTELFGTTNNFVGNPNLKPEDAVGWDAGIEQHFWNDRARMDVTYFHSDVENLITGSGNTAVNLAGVSRARGIEVSGDLALTDQIDVSGSYTWTHAETSDGTEQVRRPTNVASLAVNYRFLENRANLNLGVDFNGTFTDFEFDTAFNRTIVDMSSYTLVNLKGTYTLFDGVDVYAR
ncbi:MAG TPA: TonB-dependent receptor, partial [Rhodospirillaceae bacterium]|nr:TonB-dependent receptor [Rhodospirillaceae bacterium]